jgi:hypothetical protein
MIPTNMNNVHHKVKSQYNMVESEPNEPIHQ